MSLNVDVYRFCYEVRKRSVDNIWCVTSFKNVISEPFWSVELGVAVPEEK